MRDPHDHDEKQNPWWGAALIALLLIGLGATCLASPGCADPEIIQQEAEDLTGAVDELRQQVVELEGLVLQLIEYQGAAAAETSAAREELTLAQEALDRYLLRQQMARATAEKQAQPTFDPNDPDLMAARRHMRNSDERLGNAERFNERSASLRPEIQQGFDDAHDRADDVEKESGEVVTAAQSSGIGGMLMTILLTTLGVGGVGGVGMLKMRGRWRAEVPPHLRAMHNAVTSKDVGSGRFPQVKDA